MGWALANSGTVTPVIGTETTLATNTNNGTFVFSAGTPNMINGDEVIFRVYTKILSGGSHAIEWWGAYADVQDVVNKVAPYVASDISLQCTIQQIGGTIAISSLTGTINDGDQVTGLTSGATAIVRVPGGGALSGSSAIVLMQSGTFTNGETAQLSPGNSFHVNGTPNGRAFPWKILSQ